MKEHKENAKKRLSLCKEKKFAVNCRNRVDDSGVMFTRNYFLYNQLVEEEQN